MSQKFYFIAKWVLVGMWAMLIAYHLCGCSYNVPSSVTKFSRRAIPEYQAYVTADPLLAEDSKDARITESEAVLDLINTIDGRDH